MKQRSMVQVVSMMVLIISGTIIIFLGVATTASLISGRVRTVNASAPQAVETVAPLPLIPTSTTPPKVGDLIDHPAIQARNLGGMKGFSVRRTNATPLITQQEAQQIASETGYSYALGGTYEGRLVTVNAIYGLLTYGELANTDGLRVGDGVSPVTGACQGWLGPCGLPVVTCQAGKCQDTGRRIDRIQDRPYWLLDYNNIVSERQGCPGCPVQTFNHAVILVDAQERFVPLAFPYTAP